MNATTNTEITVFKTDELGIGAFDNGRITEIKPIPFPREQGGASRLGPLFYWAWASSPEGTGIIPWHPHEAFEITSYVISGTLGHRDTLGTDSEVNSGGIQIMRAGSGLQHREEIRAPGTEFLQIWFEPDLSKTVKQAPVYADFEAEAFTTRRYEGWTERTIIGSDSPAEVETEATMSELIVDQHGIAELEIAENSYWAALVLEGKVQLKGEEDEAIVAAKDFVVLRNKAATKVTLKGNSPSARIIAVRVPQTVDYKLLPLR